MDEVTITPVKEEKTREDVQKAQIEEQRKRDWMSYELIAPEELFKKIPKSKRQETINASKNEVIMKEMMRAKEIMLDLNSSMRQQKEAQLKLQYRNIYRQLVWNEMRMKQIKEGKTLVDEMGKTVHSWEIQYLIDKLSWDLYFLEEDLSLYGLDKSEVIKDL